MEQSISGANARSAKGWGYYLAAGLLLAAAVALMLSIPLIRSPFQGEDYYGLPLSGKAPDFSLRDTEGRPVSLKDYRGRFVFLMFGYLGCPDVCHTQSLTFYSLAKSLPGDDAHFLYLGMDPENDTPEKIAGYFDARAPNFDGLIADSLAQAQHIAAAYHAYFSVGPAPADGGRRIDHPGFIYLIDPAGDLRLLYQGEGLDHLRMAGDLNRIAARFD